ncbi:hypothetical protein N7491_009199 [Penicillium cf. griseofulvum]|uniref:Uncharacterized protein n=1 Tax=Penicillium cf. griseofulvum TaxID=2972120 RepID=A0A9W9MFG6_9EURO|nr:hypothetical protein N7472_005208 [Penicillium cf. griseofulvum]KAJ5423983.1 hypothetical protein N7491_009199 [Penicillium cf. griseofulvum]
MSAHEPSTSLLTASPTSTESPRHYSMFADYGTDFIWRDFDDLRPGEGDFLELYNAWVDTYTDNFSERRDKTQNYYADIFLTASEEVAWNVAGILLAWRITLAPQVGSIEYSTGYLKYLLGKGKETNVTLQLLQDQVDILTKGKPVA